VREFFAKVQNPGIYIVIGSLLVIALTAGRREKGFGKISKGFGALYGLINIMSDILSYARLFGLMLSGMIIAQTFNYKLGLPIIQGGGAGIILGSIIIIIGHVFNIAMGVLGAYIHDSRLQYIEFFGRFYSGEGTPFVPLGANSKYICINNAK
jgi:V/A-type H+-transporting ATPase subunit I